MKPLRHILTICAAAMLLLVTACNDTSRTAGPEPAFSLLVVQNVSAGTGDSILQFPANGSGSITPSNTVSGPGQTSFNSVALDTAGNLFIAAGRGTGPSTTYQILVYASGATGSYTLTRTITSTSLNSFITSIALDATGDLYAVSGNSIVVFAPNAAANAAPARQIAGTLTQINFAAQIAVDAAQNIYLANENGGNVLVFSSTEAGNIAPAAILSGPMTVISNPSGVAVDSSGNIYVASFNQPSNSSVLLEFAPGSSGNIAPVRTITSIASDNIYALAVDALDNLYVCDQNSTSGQLAVDVFSPSVSGSAAPTASITSTAWTNSSLGQIAVR